jgi:hypothetical protein
VVISSEASKKCVACQKIEPLSNFYSKGSYFDSRCKVCVSKTKRKNYLIKSKVKIKPISNIIVKPYDSNKGIQLSDLLFELESFLLEEFKGEQRICC